MSPDSDCISCRISTIKATARIKHQSTPVTKPGQVIYVDILPRVSVESLTPKSNFPALLILVDAFSRFTRIIGMPNKSSQLVMNSLLRNLNNFVQIRELQSLLLPQNITRGTTLQKGLGNI
jgi:hypothetical protein